MIIKEFKDIKIITGIILLEIIGVTSTSFIGIVVYRDIHKMNNNISSMYINDVESIEKEGEMLNNFQSIKVEVTKQLKIYNDKANSKIKLENENLNNKLREYTRNNSIV